MKEQLKKIIMNLIPDYKSFINSYNNTVLCSYVNDGFLLNKNSKKLLTHGNKIEAILIKEVFNDLGFNFIAIRYDKDINLGKYEKYNPAIVFGIEPNFEILCNKFPEALKIYYATGSFIEHQNNMVKFRTDYVNNLRNSDIPYYRMVPNNKAAYLADYIIQIGSDYTIDTYPEELRKKIFIIRQSSFEFLKMDKQKKFELYERNNYMWFGSNGTILKGLDLVLEYFKSNPHLYLNIIGPIDREFEETYKFELYELPNITYHGYIPIYDSKIVEIANKCSFLIYPSASEAGAPGSVINMMRLGLIPILVKYCSFNEILDIGFLIEDLTISSIENSIEKSQQMNNEELLFKFEECMYYATSNFTQNNFKNDFRLVCERILSGVN